VEVFGDEFREYVDGVLDATDVDDSYPNDMVN